MSGQSKPQPQSPGYHIPVAGGQGDGSTFFVSEHIVMCDMMDAITSRPMQLGPIEDQRVCAWWTFHGLDPETGERTAVTLVIPPEMLREIAPAARKLFTSIPLAFRTVPAAPNPDDELKAILEGEAGEQPNS